MKLIYGRGLKHCWDRISRPVKLLIASRVFSSSSKDLYLDTFTSKTYCEPVPRRRTPATGRPTPWVYGRVVGARKRCPLDHNLPASMSLTTPLQLFPDSMDTFVALYSIVTIVSQLHRF